jgi:membrane-associated HD superfamily phosphohydrolase
MSLPSLHPAVFIKLALLLGLAGAVTVMVAPHLTVGPPRVQPGDILQETLVIPESVTLEDERSTELRRRQALADFAPVYDFDSKLKEHALTAIAQAFTKVRNLQEVQSRAQGQSAVRLRQNALDRISAVAALGEVGEDLALTQKERAAGEKRVGGLSGRKALPQKDQAELERLRFELRAVEARKTALEARQVQLKTRLSELEQDARRMRGEVGSDRPEDAIGQQQIKADFELALGITLDDAAFEALAESRFGEDTEDAAAGLVGPVLDLRIVQSREMLGDGRSAIQIRTLDTAQQMRFEALQTIVDVAQARALLARNVMTGNNSQPMQMPQRGSAYRAAVLQLAQRLVRPNLTENREETERQRSELWRNTNHVFFNLKKGDVVARAGDVATAQQAEVIKALAAYRAKHPRYPQMVGTFLVVLVTFALMYQLMRQRIPAPELRLTRLALMALLMLLTMGLAQVLLLVVPALSTFYELIPSSAYTYLIPASLTSLLASVLLRFEVAVYLGFAVSICVAVMMGNSLPVFIYAMLGSAVA